MAYWWEGDDTETYWVEIRWVPGTGKSLRYHLNNEAGNPDPWHALAETVAVGDFIYHWHARENRFVGRSRVAGPPHTHDGWRTVKLQDFVPIQKVIDLHAVRSNETALVDLRDSLRSKFPGEKLYLPFQYRSDGLRFISNYFAKLPRSAVEILFDATELGEANALPPADGDEELGDAMQAGGASSIAFLSPFKPKADSAYMAATSSRPQRRGRHHETLVNDFAGWLENRGHSDVGRNAFVDLGIVDPPVIIEAKYISGGWKGPVREAIGQLYEYRYFGVANPQSSLILLASEEVPNEWVTYLEADRQIGAAWRSGKSFTLSPLAKEYL